MSMQEVAVQVRPSDPKQAESRPAKMSYRRAVEVNELAPMRFGCTEGPFCPRPVVSYRSRGVRDRQSHIDC
jgi:hypothetical protein